MVLLSIPFLTCLPAAGPTAPAAAPRPLVSSVPNRRFETSSKVSPVSSPFDSVQFLALNVRPELTSERSRDGWWRHAAFLLGPRNVPVSLPLAEEGLRRRP